MGSSNGKDIPNISKGEELSEKAVSNKEYEEEDLKDHCLRNSILALGHMLEQISKPMCLKSYTTFDR